jgi:hypothetical protein
MQNFDGENYNYRKDRQSGTRRIIRRGWSNFPVGESPMRAALQKAGLVRAFKIHGPLNRVLYQLARIPQRQFFFDVCLIGLDGLHAQV